jgi:hypothetical protein
VSPDYQPTWLRLSEAKARLMSLLSLAESEAEAWILRAIQDQLRLDPERYNAQAMFQVQGFPTQWKRRRIPLDWPARLTPDRIDWEASTIYGPDPFRLIDNNLFIEIKSSALPAAPTPSTSSTARRGRPPLDWQAIQKATFELMDHHGEFSSDDSSWNAQARLEENLQDKFTAGISTLREHLPDILAAWRKTKVGN